MPSEQERDDWLGLVSQDDLVGHILAMFMSQTSPFDEAIDAELHTALLAEEIKQISDRLPKEELRAFTSLDPKVRMEDLVDGLGRTRLGWRDVERALELFQRSTRRRPWMPNGHVFSAICYHRLGMESEAQGSLEASCTTVVSESDPLLRDKAELLAEMRGAVTPDQSGKSNR